VGPVARGPGLLGGLLGLDELGLDTHELGTAERLPLLPEKPLKEPGLVRGRFRGNCAIDAEFELLALIPDDGNPKLTTEDNEGGTRGDGLTALGAKILGSLFCLGEEEVGGASGSTKKG
jgi:hypothetical protein